jgi:hypothetical protein
MLRAGLLLAVGVVASVALAACGSCSSSTAHGTGGGDSEGPADVFVDLGPSPSQACQAYATAFCGRLESCTPFYLQAAYGDTATCVQRMAKGCMPALVANGSKVTPALMVGCATAVESQTCDEALDNQQPSACDVPGTLPMWAACGVGSQCQTGYCNMTSGLCGSCVPRVGASAKCIVDADCSATLVCHMGTCVGPGIAGAPCGTASPCMRTLTCIGAKCVAPVPVGGPCSAPTDCDGAHGAFCNPQTKTCAQTQMAADGYPCGFVATDGGVIAVACAGGESCGRVNLRGQGTCHPTAADGAVCGPDIACLAPAVCSPTARCTLPNPAFCR